MQKTPLFSVHEKYRGNIVDFHGWALPVHFSGIIDEHLTVRNQVGLFDVSHMGELLVEGPDAEAFLEQLFTNRVGNLRPGQVRYTPMCYENGGTVDDLLVYRLGETKFLLVVNASNIPKDYTWVCEQIGKMNVQIQDISSETAQIALQGPKAGEVLTSLLDVSIPDLKYFHFRDKLKLGGISALLSRTGYTGEDGFEIYLSPHSAVPLWEKLMEAGAAYGIKPIGLGARDTLRFEAGLPLYGQELSPEITPLEAGLGRFVNFEKGHFIGRVALLDQFQQGPPHVLMGLLLSGKAIARSGFRIFINGLDIGWVTTGNYSPSLEKSLALGLIKGLPDQKATVEVEIRGRMIPASIVPIPFYSRKK